MPSALAGSKVFGRVLEEGGADADAMSNRSSMRRKVAGLGLGVRSPSSMAKTPSKQSATRSGPEPDGRNRARRW